MMEISEALEKAFGKMRFYASLGNKNFAEIIIGDSQITIKIISAIGFLEAILIHVFKKHRFSSKKLKHLKKAGYRIVIKYGRIEKEI